MGAEHQGQRGRDLLARQIREARDQQADGAGGEQRAESARADADADGAAVVDRAERVVHVALADREAQVRSGTGPVGDAFVEELGRVLELVGHRDVGWLGQVRDGHALGDRLGLSAADHAHGHASADGVQITPRKSGTVVASAFAAEGGQEVEAAFGPGRQAGQRRREIDVAVGAEGHTHALGLGVSALSAAVGHAIAADPVGVGVRAGGAGDAGGEVLLGAQLIFDGRGQGAGDAAQEAVDQERLDQVDDGVVEAGAAELHAAADHAVVDLELDDLDLGVALSRSVGGVLVHLERDVDVQRHVGRLLRIAHAALGQHDLAVHPAEQARALERHLLHAHGQSAGDLEVVGSRRAHRQLGFAQVDLRHAFRRIGGRFGTVGADLHLADHGVRVRSRDVEGDDARVGLPLPAEQRGSEAAHVLREEFEPGLGDADARRILDAVLFWEAAGQRRDSATRATRTTPGAASVDDQEDNEDQVLEPARHKALPCAALGRSRRPEDRTTALESSADPAPSTLSSRARAACCRTRCASGWSSAALLGGVVDALDLDRLRGEIDDQLPGVLTATGAVGGPAPVALGHAAGIGEALAGLAILVGALPLGRVAGEHHAQRLGERAHHDFVGLFDRDVALVGSGGLPGELSVGGLARQALLQVLRGVAPDAVLVAAELGLEGHLVQRHEHDAVQVGFVLQVNRHHEGIELGFEGAVALGVGRRILLDLQARTRIFQFGPAGAVRRGSDHGLGHATAQAQLLLVSVDLHQEVELPLAVQVARRLVEGALLGDDRVLHEGSCQGRWALHLMRAEAQLGDGGRGEVGLREALVARARGAGGVAARLRRLAVARPAARTAAGGLAASVVIAAAGGKRDPRERRQRGATQ